MSRKRKTLTPTVRLVWTGKPRVVPRVGLVQPGDVLAEVPQARAPAFVDAGFPVRAEPVEIPEPLLEE